MIPNSSRREGVRSACARLSLLLVLTSAMGCTWQPIARDVQPEQIIAGPAQVLRRLDPEGRNVLVQTGDGDTARTHIVHLEGRSHCELPNTATVPWFGQPLLAPSLRGPQARAFLLPVFQRDGDPLKLYYADENCILRGPFADTVDDTLGMVQLRADGRNVSLVFDADSTMRLVDPWGGQVVKIAERVSYYSQVTQGDSSDTLEALWLIEDGKLTQRGLDGTLLMSPRGTKVSGVTQTRRDALRVAYVDEGNVWEAKGPDFTPVLIAEGACAPSYNDNALDLYMPCDDKQLVRIDLSTGAVRRFVPGVFASLTAGDFTFEQVRDNPDNPDAWNLYVVTGPMGSAKRTKLSPRPNNPRGLTLISQQRLVGLSANGQLGIWTLDGRFTAGYQGLQRLQTFKDPRTSQLLWLMAYAVDTMGIGTLGVVEQRQLEDVVAAIQADAGVPGTSDASAESAKPLVIAERAQRDGYRVFTVNGVGEQVIIALEEPVKALDDAGTFSGALNAHVLSAKESLFVDDDVQSYEGISAPVPGILYGILTGPRSGLWFAAL